MLIMSPPFITKTDSDNKLKLEHTMRMVFKEDGPKRIKISKRKTK